MPAIGLALAVLPASGPAWAQGPRDGGSSAWPVPGAAASYGAGASGPNLPVAEELAPGPGVTTTGVVIGPSYAQGSLASEAVGRQAVQLSAAGQSVTFEVPDHANAVDVSYSLPQGSTGSLLVYLDGQPTGQSLQLTSAYSYISTPWIYGSQVHHFFDDARLLLGRGLRPGTTLSLVVPASESALPITVNLADFYVVGPPLEQPRGSVPVTMFGADPTGSADSSAAFASAIAAANHSGTSVWVPPGRYLVTTPLSMQEANIEGAGDWYTDIASNELINNTAAVSGPIDLSGFSILGSTVGRHDDGTANAINGSLGTGSRVEDLWIQDTNVGLWLEYGNRSVTVRDNVILSTDADGLNLNGNAIGCVVADNLVRNTGDDGLAIWSYPAADSSNVFVHNTVEQPNLANGIADYGGADNAIVANLVEDTNALGSGLTVSNEQFLSPGFTTLSGTIPVVGNVLVRTGAMNSNWGHPMSALQIDSYDYPITGTRIQVERDAIVDSPYSAVELVSGGGQGLAITGLRFRNDLIDGAGTVVFQAETAGSAEVSGVKADNIGVSGTVQDQYPPSTPAFQFHYGPGNAGWSATPVLNYFPAPVPPVP
ncbi:MAG TPA: glycosyl hydrolase family 28-related protein [Acidimicrobiales bacterium]|nr:glycosyl hydrolase family 28-related protein [Acidimicrobiales bacterium]